MMVKRFKNINPKDVKLKVGSSHHFCGTPLEKVPKSLRHAHKEIGRAVKSIIKERVKSKKNSRSTSQPIITIPVMFHMYKRNNGSYKLTDNQVLNYISTVNSWLAGESGDNKKWELSSFNSPAFESSIPSLEILGDYNVSVPNFANTISDTRVRIELLKAIPVEFLRRFMVPTQNVKDIHVTSATSTLLTLTETHTIYNENIAINFSKDHNQGVGSGKNIGTNIGTALKNLGTVMGATRAFYESFSQGTAYCMGSHYGFTQLSNSDIPFPTYYPLTFTENPLLERRKDEAIANYDAAKLAYEDNNNATTRANLETAKHIKDLGGFVSCGENGVGSIIRYDDSLNPTGLKEFLNGNPQHVYPIINNPDPGWCKEEITIKNPLYITYLGKSSNFRFQRYNIENGVTALHAHDYTTNGNDYSRFPLYAKEWENNSGEQLGYYQTPMNSYLLEEYFYTLPCIHVHDYIDDRSENGQQSNATFPTNVIGESYMNNFPSVQYLGQGTTAEVFAHELGHNLGLRHSHDIKGWFRELYGQTNPSLNFDTTDPYREIDDNEVYFVRTYFDLLVQGHRKIFPTLYSNSDVNSGSFGSLNYASATTDYINEPNISQFLQTNYNTAVSNSENHPDRITHFTVQNNPWYLEEQLVEIKNKIADFLPSWWTGSVNDDNKFVVNKPLLDEDGNPRSSANENGHVYTTRIPFCVLNANGTPSNVYDPLWAIKLNYYNPDFPAYPDNTLTSDLANFEHCPCLWNDDGTAIGSYKYKDSYGETNTVSFTDPSAFAWNQTNGNNIKTRFGLTYFNFPKVILESFSDVKNLLLGNMFSSDNGAMSNFGYYGLNKNSLVPHYYESIFPDQRVGDNYKASEISNNHRIAKYYLGQHGNPEGDFYNPSSVFVSIPTYGDEGIPKTDGTVINFLGEELNSQGIPMYFTEDQFVDNNSHPDMDFNFNLNFVHYSWVDWSKVFFKAFPERKGTVMQDVVTGKAFADKSLFTFEGDETENTGKYMYSAHWAAMNYPSSIFTTYDYLKYSSSQDASTFDVKDSLRGFSPGSARIQSGLHANFFNALNLVPESFTNIITNDIYTTGDGAYMYSLLNLDAPFSRINVDYDETANPDVPQTLDSLNSDLPTQSQEKGFGHFRWINKLQTLISNYSTNVDPNTYENENEYTPAFESFGVYINELASQYVEEDIEISPSSAVVFPDLCENVFAENYQSYGDCVFYENFLIDNQICLNRTDAINYNQINPSHISDYNQAIAALGGGQNLTDYCSFESCPYQLATNYFVPDFSTSESVFASTQFNLIQNCEFENFITNYTANGNSVAINDANTDPSISILYVCGISSATNYWGTLEDTYEDLSENLILIDNQTCEFPVGGCMEPEACNYNPQATIQEGYCNYPNTFWNYNTDLTPCQECVDGAAQDIEGESNAETCLPAASYPYGCMDPSYLEYNSASVFQTTAQLASSTQSSTPDCDIEYVEGCTNYFYAEYDLNANADDGSCLTLNLGCIDPNALNYDPEVTISPGLTSNFYCDYPVYGCGDSGYLEYDPLVTQTFYGENLFTPNYCQTPKILGCINSEAINYDPAANTDDGSCIYPLTESECNQIQGGYNPAIIQVCSYPGITQCSVALDFEGLVPSGLEHANTNMSEIRYGSNIVNDIIYPEVVYAEDDIYQQNPCVGHGYKYRINNNLCYTGTLEFIGMLPPGPYATSDVIGADINPKNWASLDCSGSPYPVNNTFGFVQWPQHLYEGGVIIDKLPGGVNVDYDGENFEFNPDGIGLFEGKLPDMYSLFGGDFSGKDPVFYIQEGYTFGNTFIFGDTKDDYYSGPILKSSTGALFAGSFNSVGRSLFLGIEPKTVNLLVQEDKAKKVLEKIKSVQNICKFVKL